MQKPKNLMALDAAILLEHRMLIASDQVGHVASIIFERCFPQEFAEMQAAIEAWEAMASADS